MTNPLTPSPLTPDQVADLVRRTRAAMDRIRQDRIETLARLRLKYRAR